ncbi:WbuC family cupin fold metalloprotein [Sulfuriferula thiophila]|uniref:WbuC family cupin fold metalloprotein n=1 Tax=Sulfuriferula thiophila TaxID=1781211 RepID=UPI000F614F35|nr:WbuC family cupin fold metalloprotein [Sulfuriferula thiophila]
MKQLDLAMLDTLSAQAKASPRLRANANLHDELSDPIQRLAIAMEPDTVIRPHRHAHTWELLTALRGRFIVLLFNDDGVVTERVVLGEGCAVQETPVGGWHGVLSLDTGGVIFEVKRGPYTPINSADFAPGYELDDAQQGAELNRWYAQAQVGDRLWSQV